MFNDPPVRTDSMLSLLRRMQRRLLLLTAAAAALGAVVGLVVAQLPGVWGALLAAALGLAFTFTTVALLRFVAGRGPEVLQLVLIGGWIVKMVLVVILMLWLRTQDFYDRGVFFGVLVVVVLGAVVIEIGSVATSRLPYVDAPAPQVSSITPPGGGAEPQPARSPEPREPAEENTESGSDEAPRRP